MTKQIMVGGAAVGGGAETCSTVPSAASTSAGMSLKPTASRKNAPTASSFAPLRMAQAVPPTAAH